MMFLKTVALADITIIQIVIVRSKFQPINGKIEEILPIITETCLILENNSG